jgi:hypothetical protein
VRVACVLRVCCLCVACVLRACCGMRWGRGGVRARARGRGAYHACGHLGFGVSWACVRVCACVRTDMHSISGRTRVCVRLFVLSPTAPPAPPPHTPILRRSRPWRRCSRSCGSAGPRSRPPSSRAAWTCCRCGSCPALAHGSLALLPLSPWPVRKSVQPDSAPHRPAFLLPRVVNTDPVSPTPSSPLCARTRTPWSLCTCPCVVAFVRVRLVPRFDARV